MLRELERLIDKHKETGPTQLDFENAASSLRQRQFLWSDKHGQRAHYELIRRFSDYFQDLFGSFGDVLLIDPQFGYCGILPRHARPVLSKLETILLLIMAKLHDAESRKALTELGRSMPSPELLIDAYVESTKREKPKRSDVLDALKRIEKQGVIRLGNMLEESHLPEITILPNIHRVVSTSYMDTLADFAREQGFDPDDTPDDTVESTNSIEANSDQASPEDSDHAEIRAMETQS